jgi:hypothetical protein
MHEIIVLKSRRKETKIVGEVKDTLFGVGGEYN